MYNFNSTVLGGDRSMPIPYLSSSAPTVLNFFRFWIWCLFGSSVNLRAALINDFAMRCSALFNQGVALKQVNTVLKGAWSSFERHTVIVIL